MKTKVGSFLIVAAILVSVTSLAQVPMKMAERQNKQEMMQKRNFRAQAEREPFFTEEQKNTIEEIRLATAKQMKPLRNQLRELNARQQTLTTADEADLDAIYKNIEKMAEVKTEMAKIRATQQQDIRGLMTDEQLLKFDSRKQFMKNRMHRPFNNKQREQTKGFGNRKG
mgnify:CR=1 FL=1